MNPSQPSSSPQQSPRVHHSMSESQQASVSSAPSVTNEQLVQELINLRSQLNGVQQQIYQSSSSSSSSSSPKAFTSPVIFSKPPKPEPFSGERGSNVDLWLGSMDRYFQACGLSDVSLMNSQQLLDQMYHAVAFLKGTAGQWWDSLVRSSSDHESGVTLPISWMELKVKLQERYRPIAASKIARINLDQIKQFGSVDGYCKAFLNQLQYIHDMSELDKLHRFLQGLRRDIKTEVMREDPSTLHEAMTKAEHSEKFLQHVTYQGQHRSAGRPSFPSSSFRGFPSSRGFPFSSGSAPVPMELGNVGVTGEWDHGEDMTGLGQPADHHFSREEKYRNYGGPDVGQLDHFSSALPSHHGNELHAMMSGHGSGMRGHQSRPFSNRQGQGPRLSPQELETLKRQGLCFHCKKPGHTSRFCPAKSGHGRPFGHGGGGNHTSHSSSSSSRGPSSFPSKN